MKKRNWIEWLMHNYRLTFLLFAICFALGFVGIDRMAKAEFPDFVIRQGVVVAVYPGATAEEVEEQVARPLERYLFTFDEIKRKKTTSTSSAGMCMVMVELNDDVDNKDEVWSKIRHGINGFKASLPKGVLDIVVDDDFGSTSALLLAIESDRRSYRELKEYTDELADRLRRIPAADNVQVVGEIKEQISIYVDRSRLSAYGIGQMQLMQHLQSAGLTTMSGNLQNGDKDIAIHVKPSANSIGEIENTIIFTDNSNHVVRVKDIATVRKEYDKKDSYIEFSSNKDSDQRQGKPSIVLSLEMKPGNNIVQYGEDVDEVLRDFEANYLPADVKVHNIADQCKVVEKSVVDFLINLVESMLIIIIVMILLFPWRTAVVAGCIVPLNTLISVGIMYLCGIPLNTVTFAGLIIVMGMVVDNAIVVLDGYLEYLGKGLSRWHAAVASARQYFMPMALATMCLCAIFFPFLFVMIGMMGDMMEFLPWTIAINLAVSLLLAVAVIPILEVWLVRLPSGEKKKDITYHVQRIYEKVLSWTFRNPWTTIIGALGLVIGSVVVFGSQIKLRMMPYAERNQFAVEITLTPGSGLDETKSIVDSVCRQLNADERVVSVTSFVGCSSPRFHAAYAPKPGGRNYAQLIVNTTSDKDTEDLLDELEPMSDRFPNAFVKFKQLDYQNFTPFEYRFYGEDADSLRRVANDVMNRMRQDSRVMNVKTDWENPHPYVDVELDPVR
ncbi:MAG: efflux RND transporter permease subunit [Prevotella sp.]